MVLACNPANAEDSITAGALLGADEWSYRQGEFALDFAHQTPTSGEQLSVRWYEYALIDQLEGILPFDGSEPAARIEAHWLTDSWWLQGAAGVQGTFDVDGLTGELIVARAFAVGRTTLTPRVELSREPLALTPLPLSLGLDSHRVQPAIAFHAPGILTGEAGARVSFWEGDTITGRVRNSARDRIDPNRIITGYVWALTDAGGFIDYGLAAKAAAAERNTLLATQLAPERHYTWYPASAPPFAWDTTFVLRLHGHVAEPLQVLLELHLPLVSQETRQWDDLRLTSLGTAPYEGKLQIDWRVLPQTSMQLTAAVFIKPWANWNAFDDGAYRQASLHVAIEQRI